MSPLNFCLTFLQTLFYNIYTRMYKLDIGQIDVHILDIYRLLLYEIFFHFLLIFYSPSRHVTVLSIPSVIL